MVWGWNSWGHLGDSTTANKSSPIQLPGNWKQISAGLHGVFGIRDDSSLWAWGNGIEGGLGTGGIDYRSSPVQIGTDLGWNKVFGGNHRNGAAIKDDHSLWIWGSNVDGQVGDGSTTNRSSPVVVAGSWSTVSIGNDHTVGLRTDGTAWVWGCNANGQLGQGDIVYRSSPVQIAGSFIAVTAGTDVTMLINTANELWVCGLNEGGQTGTNTATQFSSPVQITGSWLQVDSRYFVSAALNTDNQLFTWGKNSNGQLGDGTIVQRSSPVQVPGYWYSFSIGDYYNMLGFKKKGT